MITIIIPLLVAVVGALTYALCNPQNAKLAELARILFFVGSLWTVYVVCSSHLRIP